MGWDAFAVSKDGQDLDHDWTHPGKILDKSYHEAFKAAEARVRQRSKSVDGYLSLGGLDVSTCGEYLGRLTNSRVMDGDQEWSPDLVVQRASIARSNQYTIKPDDEDDAWAYWSALEFLYTCEQLGLGIRFSR